jgi:uncharacterized repeat protein (TIGR01451 family)
MLPRGLGRLIAIAVGLAAGAALAQEADLATDIDGPTHAAFGSTVGFTVTYSNLGPNASDNSYVDLFIPSGLFGPIDQIPQEVLDALQASAAGPDSLGNFPLLFIEDGYCEHLRLQLQGPDWPDGADPLAGLDPGVSGSFGVELPMPMGQPRIGTLIITEPQHLAQRYLPGMTVNQLFRDAVADHRFGRGGDCDDVEPDCQVPSDCFGTRLSLIEAFEAELEAGGSVRAIMGAVPSATFTLDSTVFQSGSAATVEVLEPEGAGAHE